MTAAPTPATDEQIAHYERTIGSFVMTAQSYDHVILSLIARIHQEREQTIRECAEILNKTVLTSGGLHREYAGYGAAEFYSVAESTHHGMGYAALILALLPTPPALSQEERT